MTLWRTLERIANVLLQLFYASRRSSRQTHINTVRADAGSAWLRKFGGTDKRTPTTPSKRDGDTG